MRHRKPGRNGSNVSALGLGCMSLGIADTYISSVHGGDDAVALIHHALNLGITLLDSADICDESERQAPWTIGAFGRDSARAQKVHPIAAVQTEYPSWSCDPEDELLPALRELGIALVAYSPARPRLHWLAENVAAVDIGLSDEDRQAIEQIAPRGPVSGKRYDPADLGADEQVSRQLSPWSPR